MLGRVEELDREGEPFLVEVAGELGLDAEEFDTALIDGRHILIVDADQAEGKAIGVTGTPTYVIGGERLDGGKSQEGLRERIEEIADRLLAEHGAEPGATGADGPASSSSGLYRWYRGRPVAERLVEPLGRGVAREDVEAEDPAARRRSPGPPPASISVRPWPRPRWASSTSTS